MDHLSESSISVIIPVYNGEDFVLEAIRSVENQTLKPAKIIVVDDGSTDQTEQVVKNHVSTIPLEYVKKANGGPNSARNVGLQKCTSEFVAFLDADDIWESQKLAIQLNIFKQTKFSKLGAVYCAYGLIDDEGKDLSGYPLIPIDKNLKGMIFLPLLEANKVISSASGILVKMACFEQVGFFDETLKIGEDWDMWLRLAEKFQYAYCEEVLVKIRKHSNNAQDKQEYVFENELNFYNKWALILQEKKLACPGLWANLLSVKILDRFPRTDFLQLAELKLKQEAKRGIFRLFFGSMKMHLFAVASYLFLVNSLKTLIALAGDFKKYLKKIILIFFFKKNEPTKN